MTQFITIILMIMLTYLVISCISEQYVKYEIDKKTIKFGRKFNKAGSPIVKFRSGSLDLNFLIDTGSDCSFIDAKILKDIECTKNDVVESGTIAGVGGNVDVDGYYDVVFSYKKLKYTHLFQAFDFKESREYSGITINGILGNDFLSKYRYFIDFKNLLMFSTI